MEDRKNNVMLQQITNKLGFDIRDYNDMHKPTNYEDVHERDNIPNPFDKLSLEELLFIRENRHLLIK